MPLHLKSRVLPQPRIQLDLDKGGFRENFSSNASIGIRDRGGEPRPRRYPLSQHRRATYAHNSRNKRLIGLIEAIASMFAVNKKTCPEKSGQVFCTRDRRLPSDALGRFQIVPLGRTDVKLPRTADLLLGIFHHFLPLGDPADRARHREQHCKHRGRETQRAKHDT